VRLVVELEAMAALVHPDRACAGAVQGLVAVERELERFPAVGVGVAELFRDERAALPGVAES
jgi:hypothetical protein